MASWSKPQAKQPDSEGEPQLWGRTSLRTYAQAIESDVVSRLTVSDPLRPCLPPQNCLLGVENLHTFWVTESSV